MKNILCAMFLVLCAFIVPALATTRYVPTQYSTIQSAINACSNGDTVIVADGTYTGQGNRDISFLGKAITVRSENGPENSIIDCQGTEADPHRGFYFHNGETSSCIVRGFTIQNGYGPLGCISDDGIARWSVGGAIFCTNNSSPQILNNIITSNTATYGGGIQTWASASPLIENNRIVWNTATDGGGINCYKSCSSIIENNLICLNEASCDGGGITINYFSAVQLSNNIIAQNMVGLVGGGIFCGNSSPSIRGNTIVSNISQNEGGGAYFWYASPLIVNTIFWGNSSNEISKQQSLIDLSYSDVSGGWPSGIGNINTDPLFVSGPLGDFYLSQLATGQAAQSPCVDVGSDLASNLGMDTYTTRTDGVCDVGMVDMGYHYTPEEPELESWSFVQISDTHIGYGDARTNLALVLNKVLKDVKPKFILNTGDVADYGCWRWPVPGTPDKCKTDFYKSYSEAIKLATDEGVRVYSIPGNHDQRLGPLVVRACDNFPSCFNDPLDDPDNWFLLGRSTFTYDDNILFVTLDTGNGNCEGALTTADISFLNGLDKQVPKIILTHHPAVALANESSLCPHQNIVENQQDFLNYCEDATNNVYIVLSGHTHKNHVYDKNLGVPTDYPMYVQTGSAGDYFSKPDGEPLFFRTINVSSPPMVQDVTQLTKENYNYLSAKIYPPENLQVYDSNGDHTGYDPVSGSERGIPHSVYFSYYVAETEDGNTVFPEEVLIFDPCDDYLYQAIGTDNGRYRLEISSVEDGNNTVFEANDIPTLPGAVHQYLIDWDALSEGLAGVTVFIDREGDGDFEKTVLSDSVLTSDEFDTPSVVEVIVPEAGDAVQDGITLTAEATDIDGVDAVYFYVREPNDGNGVPIGREDLAATFNPVTGKWEYSFDTTQLPDGYYVVLAKAVDSYGNEGWSEVVPFSVRNWAVIKLLPATPSSKAGRTMPVKFSIRIAQSVDPATPFVYNEDLEIRIYKSTSPSVILQRSLFGPGDTDYRIDTLTEKYITNFKTLTTPATYVIEIWRPQKNFKVGSFTFKTVK